MNDNGPIDEEEAYVEEVHTFHKPVKKYDLRDLPHRFPRAGGPFTTSIPLNNFSTPPDPNASNNRSYTHVSKQYLSKEGQTQMDMLKGKNVEVGKDKVVEIPREAAANLSEEKLAVYVAEELKKLKVSLSSFELLRVPTIRNAVLGAYSANSISQDKSFSESVNKASSSQSIGRKIV